MAQMVLAGSTVYDVKGVKFETYGAALRVEIETENLLLRSVEERDFAQYKALFMQRKTMSKFADNEMRIQEKGEEVWKIEQMESVAKRMDLWVRRWKQDNDPYSAFAIFKKSTPEFVGHIVAGHGDKPGQSELAYIIHENEWNKGYGTEAVSAIVQRYLPVLKECGYQLEGVSLDSVIATVRLDNDYSVRILEKLKMVKIEENEKWGGRRAVYQFVYSKA